MDKRCIQPDGLPKASGFTHVVSVAGTRQVFIAGQVAVDAQRRVVGAGDLRVQTHQVMRNLQLALQAADATFADVVKLTIYVVDYNPDYLDIINEVRSQYLSRDCLPASTLVGVQSLVAKDLIIEIEAIAVL